MPVVNDEYGYIGEQNLGPTMNQKMARQAIWATAVAGGYGSVGDDRLFNGVPPEVSGDWHDAPEYTDIKLLINFFTTNGIEYWKMASNNGLLSNLSTGARTYLLAEPGRQYVVYAANGGSFSMRPPNRHLLRVSLRSDDRHNKGPRNAGRGRSEDFCYAERCSFRRR